MLNLKYSQNEINEKRNKIYNEFICTSPNVNSGIITKISSADLKLLFDLYDCIFLNGCFKEKTKLNIIFSLSKRMTHSAGKTIYPKNLINISLEDATFEIRMCVNFFFNYYETNRIKLVNGINTKDSLEAFQLVFEHEICHLIELIEFKDSDCKGDRFKTIASNIFGHKGIYHELPTNKETANIKYGVNIGDKVSFIFEDKKYQGFITNINKRATIMVIDPKGQYMDKLNNRYKKYYVPLSQLKSTLKKQQKPLH